MKDRTDERKEILEYVERFAGVLNDSGLQRMTARVFSYVLIDDADTYTAAEVAEGLDISLAAVSGAVRELANAGLLIKGRRTSTRADVYRLNDSDIWGTVMLDRSPIVDRYLQIAVEGLESLPAGPGRSRIAQTAAFMEFMKTEMGTIRELWLARRGELTARFEERCRDSDASG
ncbi:MAG TPA: hypothetical protein VHG10_07635 [Glycomyces sp.]|nr:hypothetical protein [Glycomyces sp.]